MQQHLLKAHYLSLFRQAREKSAEWYVYRHAAALLGGTGDLTWVREELKKERSACLRYAQRDGALPDTDYGTYGSVALVQMLERHVESQEDDHGQDAGRQEQN